MIYFLIFLNIKMFRFQLIVSKKLIFRISEIGQHTLLSTERRFQKVGHQKQVLFKNAFLHLEIPMFLRYKNFL